MMRRLFTLGVFLCALPGATRADPYWVVWEGNDFPENEGWERRVVGDGPAIRTLQDGFLTIDSLWSMQVADFYRMDRQLNPGPDEMFVMQWRLRVDEVIDNDPRPFDPGVSVFSDDDWGLGFQFGVHGLQGAFEHELLIPYKPGVFHDFELHSNDMRSYSLWIDGALAATGYFWEPAVTRSRVGWGDFVQGAASLSSWDYFRVGVVPEPTAGFGMVMLGFVVHATHFLRRHR